MIYREIEKVKISHLTDKTKNTTTVELRNLQAKTAYTLKISAQNAVGSGSEASFSFKTKEVSVPVQLNMTSARAGSEATSYNIVWSEPDDGGAPITKYIIKYKKVSHNPLQLSIITFCF